MNPILEVNDLHVSFDTYAGEVKAVRGISFQVKKGEFVAIVGESGCGKTVTCEAIMGLLPKPQGQIKQGEILLQGENLVHKTEKEMEQIRGRDIAMIFQDPMTSLNPTMMIGKQIAEGLVKHHKLNKKNAYEKVIDLLGLVGIPEPEKRARQYPHQFSGGMRQRAMIALSIASSPKVLIADEPTTALDVTIQAQILDLMQNLQKTLETSTILITHDLGVVAEVCDRVIVMYAGKVVEKGTVDEIFYNPQHPYTKGLLKSVPKLGERKTLYSIRGTPPDLINPPKGCPFASRCDFAMKICVEENAQLDRVSDTQHVACWMHHPLAQEMIANK